MRFGNVDVLLGVKDSNVFQSIMTSISCLTILAEVENTEEVSKLVDIIKDQRVVTKGVVVIASAQNLTSLLNKSFNFNVFIHYRDIGN